MRMTLRAVRPSSISVWTSLSGKQPGGLVAQLWARRPDGRRGRPWALGFPDRVLLVALGWRTDLTYAQLGELFAISDSAVARVMADLGPHFAALLGSPPTDRRELWLVDGTLIPVRDRRGTAKSKNCRRSVNIQVVARARDRRVVAVGDAWPGNRNDVVVYRETLADQLKDHPRISGDGGYRGAPGVRSPAPGPDGRIVRDRNYTRFRRRRAGAEHVLAELKCWKVLRDCRRGGDAITTIARGVAAMHNLRLDDRATAAT